MGKFNLNDYEKPHCIIAGGIGVTPIRSFLKQMDLLEINPNNMKVLYSDDRGEFAYKETFELINNKYDGLEILNISDRNMLSEEIDLFVKNNENKAMYYISGTPGMVNFMTQKLVDLGIENNNIKTDLFFGY
jgi:ferredoxin-NADP reductase